ncbi:hypothetical protein PUMCH_002504 [Australozyma saopauloensis]|uniref:Myosin-1 n=1 Tax=Australozyma saopauloensis TaxID=291208 RepID=A0AAX4HBN7_9ASCO|nr:hypothetical protein PUMCH_002504 [[Candida] saopauloensis]
MGLVNRKARSKPKEQVVPAKTGIKKAEFDLTKKKEVGVSDLTLLSDITEKAINENLHKRFMNGTIYTYIGHVLISVNPFQDLGIYTPQTLNMYKGKNRLEVPPHVFAIAETMYYNLKSYGDNQCVIISGESGAGKTEAAKQIMQYIANVSVDDNLAGAPSGISKIKDMVLATNPLLESFGCAKTLRNNNSSRHGKYLEIYFNAKNQPSAAHITNYLLEKQRVVQQIENERNFHIFYQFTKNCPPQYQLSFGIQGPETYVYTSAAKCVDADGINDAKDFKETLDAMRVIGLNEAEQDNIFRMLASILWIGNISFVEDEQGNAAIRDESVTNFVAYLLQVDAQTLVKALIERILTTSHGLRRGSTFHTPLNIVQATATRDALAKGIYNNLFEWIVERVNLSLKDQAENYEKKSIGILDIYGFEIFEHNSFEQICINYVNEKLQQIFIQLTLKAEQDEYVQEQITWTPIDYFNNKVVCDLIEATKPRPGLFAALNDSIKTAHADSDQADQVFAQRLVPLADGNRYFEDRRGKFIIKHYAGDVAYEVAGMTDKNKDNMLRDLLELLSCSQNTFITESLFPAHLLGTLMDSKKRPETASDKIKRSANALVDTLSQCQPSYIRTIKPNQTKRPKEYDNQQVLHQIKYLGLKENVRIRRAGFAYRTTFDKFVQRFYLLSPKTGYAGDYIWRGDDIGAVKEILKSCFIPSSEYQMGTTKVFIKQPETLFALEGMRDKYWHNMAARIQRAWRHYVQRKVDAAIVIQRAWRNKTHGNKFEQARDRGNQMLQGKKERRRLSMLGSRSYMGDYLGCNYPTGYGRFVVSLADIRDPVLFSGEGEILLAKFGRSSKRLQRSFVLTKSSLYIIAHELVENRLQLRREFVIPLSGINYIGMSLLQDDWLAISLHAPTPTTPDVFINLPLKTELVLLITEINRGISLNIEPTVKYQKKAGKFHTVKFVSGAAPDRGDIYKSGTVTVQPGLDPRSVNPKRPRPKSKPVDYSKYYNRGASAQRNNYSRPVPQPTRQGDYSQQPQASYAQARPAQVHQPVVQQQPQATQPQQQQQQQYQRQQPQPQQVQQESVQKAVPARPVRKVAPAPPAKKSAPPPPPPALAVAKPKFPTYKVIYDYDGSVAGTMALTKDDIVYVVQVNGEWGLVKDLNETKEGWAPLTYMKECELNPNSIAKSAPPPPPPVAQKSQPVAQNGNGGSLGAGLANALSAKKNEEVHMASSLADALKKRGATRTSSDEEADDDDDW